MEEADSPTQNGDRGIIRAGNIARYLSTWKSITNNNFILRIIEEGYKIQFISNPVFPPSVISSTNNPSKFAALSNEINKHLVTGAISKTNPDNFQILSRLFTVKKANGKDRMILDLSKINDQINKVSFRMETVEDIMNTLEQNDYMASIDLSDAFFSVPIHDSCKKYLCFQFDNQTYHFNVLPFGMSSSPRIFSKVLKPVISHLRSLGVRILSYLDDIFICASSYNALIEHINLTLNLLISLGYFPNYEKSLLIPSQSMIHLGFKFNSLDMTISVPEEKVVKIQSAAKKLLSSTPTLRSLSSFIGLAVSLKNAFLLSPCYYRNLQFLQCSYIKSSDDWDTKVVLDQLCVDNLTWWSKCPSPLPPTPLKQPEPILSLSTDSSKTGWGGVLSTGETVSGQWSTEESSMHINFLELKAIFFCLLSFMSVIVGKSISIFTDNQTSVYYLNKFGGTHSKALCDLAIQIRLCLYNNNIDAKAFHIAGIKNSIADKCSRDTSFSEYYLNKDIFLHLLSQIKFSPSLDLFASRLSAQLPNYVSRFHDPFSRAINAFSFKWPDDIYVFPPINLVTKVVDKFIRDNVDNALLITPAWQGLVSLPKIMTLLIDYPIFISSVHLEGCVPTRRPLPLMAWPTSTNQQKRKAYRKILLSASSIASQNLPSHHTVDIGNNLASSLMRLGHKIKFV